MEKVITKKNVIGEVIKRDNGMVLVLAHADSKSKTVVGWFNEDNVTPYLDVEKLTFAQKASLVNQIQKSVPNWNQSMIDEYKRLKI